MNIPAKLTISRNSNDEVAVQIVDALSGARFVDLRLTLEEFAMAITGCAFVPCSGEVRGLDVVGKQKVIEPRTAICPKSTHTREELEQWLVKHCQEEGWTIDPYLHSQHSVSHQGGGATLRYSVFKYVEAK